MVENPTNVQRGIFSYLGELSTRAHINPMRCYCCNLLTGQAGRDVQILHHCYDDPLTKRIQKHRNGTGHKTSD